LDLFSILVHASTRDIRDKRVNFDDFETIKIIGRGAFGTVDLVRRKATGQVYAMKTLSKFEMVKTKLKIFFENNRTCFIVCSLNDRIVLSFGKNEILWLFQIVIGSLNFIMHFKMLEM
jgi:serine/threonine protein kinase